MKKTVAFLLAVIFLAGCGAPTPDANTQQTDIAGTTAAIVGTELAAANATQTVVAGYTPTPAPATATPEVPPEPGTPVNLSEANNTGLTVENGAWVVKNPAGQITATWTGAEWLYNMEAITVSRTIVGFEGQDAALLDPLFARPLEDTPDKHFTDPATGQPLPYGYVREEKISAVSTENVPYEIPISMYAVRMLGVVQATTTNNAVVLEMPLTVDRTVVFVMDENITQGILLYALKNEDIPAGTSLVQKPAVLLQSSARPDLLNGDLRGQQMLIGVYHDIPDVLWQVYPQWNINETSRALLAFLQDPSQSAPAYNAFDSLIVIPPVWNAALWVPASVVEGLQAQQ